MQHQLPLPLLDSLQDIKGFDAGSFIQSHESNKSLTSIRINPAKTFDFKDAVLQIEEKVPWSSSGFYLKERPSFTLDPLFHAGAYYVQEASSMFLEEVLKQNVDVKTSLKVLDLCAAPGGKSTLIQSFISTDSLLVSNEVIKTRVNVLSENTTKWGAKNIVVTNNDPKDFQRLPGYFDVIIVDAPCSGSGLFRKDPDAIKEWSVDNVALCSQRQQRILADIMPSLKPGGLLIYSTCSYSYDENESICDWLTAEYNLNSIKINTQKEWNIVETESPKNQAFGYRFYPDKVKGEGFFVAAFRNRNECLKTKSFNAKHQTKISLQQTTTLSKWIMPNDALAFFNWKDDCIAFPAFVINEIAALQSALYIKKAGVNMGSIIRDELIPSHELAMSDLLREDINTIELDKENALQYLRHQSFEYSGLGKGWLLVKYGNLSLGFVKAMSNRVNNYYPKEWRIFNK